MWVCSYERVVQHNEYALLSQSRFVHKVAPENHKGKLQNIQRNAKQSRVAIAAAYEDIGVYPDDQGILNIGVSYDGSWQKRVYSSHNGMGSVIDFLTGLPIDYEVLSNFCQKCKIFSEKPDDLEWKEKHRNNCPKKILMALQVPWRLPQTQIHYHFK